MSNWLASLFCIAEDDSGLTDTCRIEWLDVLARQSYTGISIEYVPGSGYRFMSRHKIDDFYPTLRKAIDNGIRLRQDVKTPPPMHRKR